MLKNPRPKPHERLRAAMELKGYNQETMAKAVGLSWSAFSLKINGHREFTLAECNLMVNQLGMTLDEIFFYPYCLQIATNRDERWESKGGVDMKEGITKKEFITKLSELIRMTRLDLDRLELIDNDTVRVYYSDGYCEDINITMNSGMAIIRDVARRV